MAMESLLAIDPGLEAGYAFFPAGKLWPIKAEIIKPDIGGKDFFVRLRSTIRQYATIVKKYGPQFVCIEWPGFFEESAKGKAAAVTGSVVKLAFGIGKFAQVAEAYGATFIPVQVAAWKGQLPKRVVAKRIDRLLPPLRLAQLKLKSHSYDAVGIGLYCRGIFR